MARRLAGVSELFAVAAEQYLPVIDAVDDAAERRAVVGLLRRAADQARLTGNYALVNALLAGALRLIEPGDIAARIEVHTARHAALHSLGRLEEADEDYRTIEELRPTTVQRADATVLQVRSLTLRNRYPEAVDLGLESLRELGIDLPAADRLDAELDHQFDHLYRWLNRTEAADDLNRPDITEPALIAASRLIEAVLPAIYFVPNPAGYGWLSVEALRIWLEHGPSRALLCPASDAALAAVGLRGDYTAGYRAVRRLVALGEARGYEPDTSNARRVFAILSCWVDPIEHCVEAARRAREGLIAGGELGYAGYTFYPSVASLLDCGPTLSSLVAEAEAGLGFLRRTGSEQAGQWIDPYRWLAGVMRGENSGAAPVDRYAGNPLALLFAHLNQAIADAIFGDPAGLERHSAAAMPLLPAAPGIYSIAVAHLLRGLALAGQARAGHGTERGDLLSELDDVTGWLAARAADAPDNFRHLQRLLEAERAWAVGDFRAASQAFDPARLEVARRQRPWHRALITERTARFYLAHGLEQAGRDLLARARQDYAAWGAMAKVAQLDWAYPTSRLGALTTSEPGGDRRADDLRLSSTVTTGTLDLLGILAASQALSSETSIERLHTRVVEVLSAMTGATEVRLLLWSDDRHDWLLPAAGAAAPISGTGHEHTIPTSVLRYVQRTREPLVVTDATHDDRFALDPYFTDV